MTAETVYPAVVSTARIVTLLASLCVALGSGTNYVFSAYAPQLGAKLHISHTQLNVVGLAGNVGMYLSGPFWGRIVDSRGPRPLLLCAFFCLLSGYSGIRWLYNAGLASVEEPLSLSHFTMLIICSFLTGTGGSAGAAAAMNTTAKTFPDRARATTTGFVLSGFGLSAFFFSAIAHTLFAGDTSQMLLLLAIGTSLPMLVGLIYVRPIPLPPLSPHGQSYSAGSRGYGRHSLEQSFIETGVVDAAVVFQAPEEGDGSEAPLLSEEADPEYTREADNYVSPQLRDSTELSPTPRATGGSPSGHTTTRSISDRSSALVESTLPNIHGKALWMCPDFLLLCLLLSLLAGTGLMYINNVGSMSQALYAKGNSKYDKGIASLWQATQVSSISITNFLGRILIGLAADSLKNNFCLPRSYNLVIVSALFLASQLLAASIQSVQDLWQASTLLGLAYGGVFGLFPTLCIEWFGLAHFSENWGFLALSPMGGGNLFSLAFGRNLDAHAPQEASPPSTPSPTSQPSSPEALGMATSTLTDLFGRGFGGPSSAHQCLQGRECYVDSLRLTTIACLVALVLSVYAGWRDRRKGMARV